jgi:hypothetical protein
MEQTPTLYSKLVSSLDGIVWEADGTLSVHFVSPQARRYSVIPSSNGSQPNFCATIRTGRHLTGAPRSCLTPPNAAGS